MDYRSLASALPLCFLFLLLGTGFQLGAARKIPSYIPMCRRSEPNMDQCLLNTIETMRPYLSKGIPKLRIPPLEPLFIPRLDINRDNDNLKIKATLINITVYGPTSFQIRKLKTNLNKLYGEATVFLPHVFSSTDYDVDGRLLVIPLKGKGYVETNITNTLAEVKATGEILTNKKGVEYLQIKTIQTKIRVGDHNSKFISKDDDRNNKLITETAAAFINENRRQVLDIVTPLAEETAAAFALQLGNSILKEIPLSEILPD